MNSQEKTLRDQAEEVFNKIFENARGNSMKSRLKAVRDACDLIISNGGTPTPPEVVSWIASNRASALISIQTIYNSRILTAHDGTKVKGPSLYQSIIDAWSLIDTDRKLAKKSSAPPVTNTLSDFISDADLKEIDNPVVRHKISVVLGRVNQLTAQARLRDAIKNNPPVPGLTNLPGDAQAIGYDDLGLDEDEIDALSDFLTAKQAERRGLEFNDVGTVMAKRVNNGKSLSKPAFVDALRKILLSYRSISQDES